MNNWICNVEILRLAQIHLKIAPMYENLSTGRASFSSKIVKQ